MKAKGNKLSVYSIISSFRINIIFSKLTAYKARILVYHGVTREVPNVFNWQQIPLDQFVEQMKYLKKHYNVVSLSIMLEYILYKKKFPKRWVALTFDDGYENNFSVVYPILKDLNFPATFFISTAFIGNGNKSLWFDLIYNEIVNYPNSDIDLSSCGLGILDTSTISAKSLAINLLCRHLKLLSYQEILTTLERIFKKEIKKIGEPILFPGMNWKQIQILGEDPLITIGGHSHSHPILNRISEEEALREIDINKKLLENNIKKPVTVFSYPNGNWNSRLISLLKRAGYEFALTTEENFVTSNPYAIERITVRHPSSIYLFEALVSGLIPTMKTYLSFLKHYQ
jgi:peptidoglycan/xylan/chitin deacetylase (PgdA/CDA1 family)